MCLGILLFFPYMKWFSIFSLYLLTGTLRPTATEKFADCVLELVVLDVKTQQTNQIALAQSQGNLQVANQLKKTKK